MNENAKKILQALENDPALIDTLLKAPEEPVTRGMPSASGPEALISQLLGGNASAEDISSAEDALRDNKVLQLLSGAEGSLDAKELISYVGGLENNETDDKTVRAFLDGKLDLKEILLIIMLLKMFKKKNSHNSTFSTGSSFLSTMLGLSQPQQNTGLFSNLFGYQQPQQSTSLFSNLFGYQQPQQNTGLFSSLFGVQQPQNTNPFLQLFGVQQPQQSTGLFGFPTSQTQTYDLSSLLQGFVSGNTTGAQSQQLYSLLNNASNTAVNSNGQVNVSSLFSLLGQLLG